MKKTLTTIAKSALNQAVTAYVPQKYQPLATSVATAGAKAAQKRIRKRNRNKAPGFTNTSQTVTSIPAQVGVSASHMARTHKASYNFTLITSLLAKSASLRLYLSPKMDVANNSTSVQVDPKIFLDAQRHREYRIVRAQAHYPAGITSTATGTIFLAGSQDANVAQPESTTYSYIQKNSKSSITNPTSFTLPVDTSWKTIEFYNNSSTLSTADKKTLLAGVFDVQFMIDTTTFAGIRLDFTLDIEYRGLNPEFSALSMGSYPVAVADVATNYNRNMINFFSTSPLPTPVETPTLFKLPLEPGFNLLTFKHTGTNASAVIIRDKDGTDVNDSRVRLLRFTRFQGGQTGSTYEIYTGDGTSLTQRESYTATDLWVTDRQYLIYTQTGDYAELSKTTSKTSGRIVFDVLLKQVPKEQAGNLVAIWDPAYDPQTLPIV